MPPILTAPPDPNTRRPKLALPAGAWDCLIHVYGRMDEYPFHPLNPYTSAECLPETYIRQQEILGLSRAVISNGAGYCTDNRYMLKTMERFPGRFRGVTYVPQDIEPRELRALSAKGLRGARFAGGPAWPHLPRITPRICATLADAGWHAEFLTFKAGGMADELDLFLSLPGTIVIDHFGKLDALKGLDDPGFTAILKLLDTGRVWLKMSGPRGTSQGHDFPYAPLIPFARKLVAHAPDRLLWASNWPHPMRNGTPMDNDGDLVDLIAEWIPDAQMRQRILVDNPSRLYDRSM